MDDLLQWGAVVAVLIAVAIYLVRKMTRKKDDGCDINDNAGKDREKRQKQ